MSWFVSFITFFLTLSGQVISQSQTQQAANCGVPLNVVSPRNIDQRQMMGKWYEYMYRTPGIDDINTVNIYTPLGYVRDQANGWALGVNWTVSFYFITPNGNPCVGIFTSSSFNMNGQRIGQTYLPNQQSPAPTTYISLFTDYHTVEVLTRCQTPNQQTGKCSEPLFFVNTRAPPGRLSTTTKNYIAKVVNQALAPYCYTTSDLKFTAQNNTLPNCNPQPPAGFPALLQSLHAKTPHSSHSSDSAEFGRHHL